ncbi:hypothetical protein [Spirosoma koreense]
MLYVLWALLNLGLFLFFVSLCFRATKFIRENIGRLASLVFVVGLLAFVGNSGRNRTTGYNSTNSVKKWEFNSRHNAVDTTLKFAPATIDKTLLSEIDLVVLYGREKASVRWVPIEATSTKAGFASGHVWTPTRIIVDSKPQTGKFMYAVDGLLDWTLLGVPIYTESKTYTGFINVKVPQ